MIEQDRSIRLLNVERSIDSSGLCGDSPKGPIDVRTGMFLNFKKDDAS